MGRCKVRVTSDGELDFEYKSDTRRVIIKGGGFQARANLNGGELGKGPSPSMEKSIIRKIGVKGGL